MQPDQTPASNPLIATATSAFAGAGSRVINAWSMTFALAAMLVLGLTAPPGVAKVCFAVSIVAAIGQAYFAVRCAIDAALFNGLGANTDSYADLDRLLAAWKFRSTTRTRSLEERARGAMRLLKRQVTGFALQAVMLAAALATMAASPTG